MSEMTEEVVEHIAEELPEFVESLTKLKVQFTLLGTAIGTAAGAVVAFAIAYRKAEKKYSELADVEIAEMREHYHTKGRALEAEKGKGDLETLVTEKGYVSPEPKMSASPPMAVQPPSAVLESEDTTAGEPDDSEMGEDHVEGPEGVKAPPPEPAVVRNIFRERENAREAAVPREWDWRKEQKSRRTDRPYVIHYEEKHDALEAGFSDVSLTYYADDVLCDDHDEIMDPADRDITVGEINLDRFGEGSNDPNIVFVRNDNLEILYEIVKSENDYAEEVHGFKHEAWDRGNLERMRSRERDDER